MILGVEVWVAVAVLNVSFFTRFCATFHGHESETTVTYSSPCFCLLLLYYSASFSGFLALAVCHAKTETHQSLAVAEFTFPAICWSISWWSSSSPPHAWPQISGLPKIDQKLVWKKERDWKHETFKSQNADVEELSRRLCSLATTTHVLQQLTQFLLTSIIKKIEEGKIQFPSRIPDLLMRNKKAESGSVNAMRHVKGKNAASL